jgi:hypothetical protein
MMTDRELMQQALSALVTAELDGNCEYGVTDSLRARLAQPEPWVKTYSGGKPNYTEPCPRCGKVNPAEIHTCSPIENLTTEKNIQISDKND